MATSTLVLGLDVGNTAGCVGVLRSGGVEVVTNEQGSRTTPAVIAFSEAETLIGESAVGQLTRNAANTVVDGLRLLGRDFDDEAFQSELAKWRFQVSRGKDGKAPQVDVHIKGEAKSLAPPRLLSHLLARLRADADAFTGETVKEAALVVPAHFDTAQRAALKEAAQIGGVRVKMVLPAPLCVAVLYAHEHSLAVAARDAAAGAPPPRAQQLLVVDVGGSSTEASVVEMSIAASADGDGAESAPASGAASVTCEQLCVRASVHAHGVGAASVDAALMQHVLKEIRRRQRVDLSDNSRAKARLLAACHAAKHSLSSAAQAQVTTEADGADYFANVSRATLEELSQPVAKDTASLAMRALSAAGLEPEQVDALLLAGGGCRMARVAAALTALCPHAPVHFGAISEEAASRGAALAGGMIKSVAKADSSEVSNVLVTRPRLPRALGVRTADGSVVVLAPCRAPVPLTRTLRFGCAAGTSALLLALVEMAPPEDGAIDVSDAPPAAVARPADAATAHTVATLAVRDVPAGCEALLVRLCVEASGSVELSCEAAMAADGDDGDAEAMPRQVLAKMRV